jgi:hypothetical protein
MSEMILEVIRDGIMRKLKEKISEAETQEEADEIIDSVSSLDLTKITKDLAETMSTDITQHMIDTMYEQVFYFRAEEAEFLARMEQKWHSAFVSSEVFYILVLEATQEYFEEVKKLDEKIFENKKFCFHALQHLQARGLQQFLEITTLIKGGFADGAYARWRSMYELSVISSFISENGEKVAKSFIEASDSEDRYDWAKSSGLFKEKVKKGWHITFSDIERKVDMNNLAWKSQYVLANQIVHASPQGTFKRLGNFENINLIPAGRSDYGITTPAEHSAISLAMITVIFFATFSPGDTIVSMKYIMNWLDVIREKYFKAHDDIFPADEKLWDDSLPSFENDFKHKI